MSGDTVSVAEDNSGDSEYCDMDELKRTMLMLSDIMCSTSTFNITDRQRLEVLRIRVGGIVRFLDSTDRLWEDEAVRIRGEMMRYLTANGACGEDERRMLVNNASGPVVQIVSHMQDVPVSKIKDYYVELEIDLRKVLSGIKLWFRMRRRFRVCVRALRSLSD